LPVKLPSLIHHFYSPAIDMTIELGLIEYKTVSTVGGNKWRYLPMHISTGRQMDHQQSNH
jgi:hypothetical protein